MMLATAIALCLAPAQDDDVLFEPNVVYGKGGPEELKLNLARPKDASMKRPCVLVIHGGGWAAGDRAQHNPQAKEFARKGYVAATVGYRLAPKYVFPAQVEDVKCAVRFLRANAEKYGIDPDRFGAVGFSAGAHLSMMLGTLGKDDGFEGEGGHPESSSKVQAVVEFFGPSDLTSKYPEAVDKILATFLGGTKADRIELYRKASPVTYVTRDDAPTLIIQGTKDRLVPWEQGTIMADALTKAGVPGRAELLLGADHGWGQPELDRTVKITMDFFDLHLKKK